MKQLGLILLSLLLFYNCDTQKVYNRTIDANGSKMLVGRINKEGLMKEPFKEWYEPEYNDYKMDSALVKTLKNNLRLYRLEIFMGTWCSDSKREIPRLMKILDDVRFLERRVDLYAVNRQKGSFYGEEIGKDIRYVPTIILYRGDKEVNRIVEYPIGESLEQDLLTIISGQEYTPNYSEE